MWLYDSNQKASRSQNQSHLPAIQIATNHARILLSYITAKVERRLASRCSRLFCLFTHSVSKERRQTRATAPDASDATTFIFPALPLRRVAGRVREFMYFDAAADVLHILDPFGARNVTKN